MWRFLFWLNVTVCFMVRNYFLWNLPNHVSSEKKLNFLLLVAIQRQLSLLECALPAIFIDVVLVSLGVEMLFLSLTFCSRGHEDSKFLSVLWSQSRLFCKSNGSFHIVFSPCFHCMMRVQLNSYELQYIYTTLVYYIPFFPLLYQQHSVSKC